ncbi:hypothetical protein FC40_GL001244 [Ligilactobacillus hayakitensis DSM 18933 = JCM 14209]|uniref:Uncharacterized protein n=2 Tax=Ligilactobacillus TaxID=2767887 RepID=A0A0R1WWM8_9LACO|nr:hypothetical protein FC40_GL001244 [Ligilactobacillus hayakitensis DSM 18933 = JCM 14209]
MKVTVEDSKIGKFIFENGEIKKLQKDCQWKKASLSYLGLIFDGVTFTIKSSTVHRYSHKF